MGRGAATLPPPRFDGVSSLYAHVIHQEPCLGARGFISRRNEAEVLRAERLRTGTPEFAQAVAFSTLYLLSRPISDGISSVVLAVKIAEHVDLAIPRGAVIVAAHLLGYAVDRTIADEGAVQGPASRTAPSLQDNDR